MTTSINKWFILLVVLLVGCSNQYVDSDIRIISKNQGSNKLTLTNMDSDLTIQNQSDLNFKGNVDGSDTLMHNQKLYTISRPLKSSDVVEVNLDYGNIKKIDYANTVAAIGDSIYYNSNLVGDLAILKYDTKTKQKVSKAIVGDAIFQIISYENRLFAFVEDLTSDKHKTYFIEVDKDSLEQISRREIPYYNSFIKPIINNGKVYYIVSESNEVIAEDLDGNNRKTISLKFDQIYNMRLIDNNLFIVTYNYNSDESTTDYFIRVNVDKESYEELPQVKEVYDIKKDKDFYYVLNKDGLKKLDLNFKEVKSISNDVLGIDYEPYFID